MFEEIRLKYLFILMLILGSEAYGSKAKITGKVICDDNCKNIRNGIITLKIIDSGARGEEFSSKIKNNGKYSIKYPSKYTNGKITITSSNHSTSQNWINLNSKKIQKDYVIKMLYDNSHQLDIVEHSKKLRAKYELYDSDYSARRQSAEVQKKKKRRELEREIDFNDSYDYIKMLKDQIKGKNNSWAVRWYISVFLQDMITLYPGQSYVQNIGFDNDATHCKGKTDFFNVNLNNKFKLLKINPNEDPFSRKKIENFFNSINTSIYKRLKSKITNLIK